MADLATQEKIAAQSAVEILHDRTGTRGLGDRLQNRLVDRLPSLFQQALASGPALPVEVGSFVQGLNLAELLDGRHRHGKTPGDLGELLVQDLDKPQQSRALVSQHPHQRPDALGTVILIAFQFRDDEVIQGLPLSQRGPVTARTSRCIHSVRIRTSAAIVNGLYSARRARANRWPNVCRRQDRSICWYLCWIF